MGLRGPASTLGLVKPPLAAHAGRKHKARRTLCSSASGRGVNSGRDKLALLPWSLGRAWQVLWSRLQQDLKGPAVKRLRVLPRSARPTAMRGHLPHGPCDTELVCSPPPSEGLQLAVPHCPSPSTCRTPRARPAPKHAAGAPLVSPSTRPTCTPTFFLRIKSSGPRGPHSILFTPASRGSHA